MPLGCMGIYTIGTSKVGVGSCGLPGTFNKITAASPTSTSTHPVGPVARSA